MRKSLWTLFAALALMASAVSCNFKKGTEEAFSSITRMVDSAIVARDTVAVLAKAVPEEEEVKPNSADELFEDFIFSFSSDERLQKRRIKFPLPVSDGDSVYKVDRKAWRHDSIFNLRGYYTLLFDYEEDMELEGDTSLMNVRVEDLLLGSMTVKNYFFGRRRGAWMLDSIDISPVSQNEDESFAAFYEKFATDSLFQSRHVKNPLEFVTLDPDDEFSILKTTLGLNQWFAFRPELPTEILSSIDYGQRNSQLSSTKIMKVNGISSGFSNVLYFKMMDGRWMMYKFEDTSI